MKFKLTKDQKAYIEDIITDDIRLRGVFGFYDDMKITTFCKKIKTVCKEYCLNKEATRYAKYLGDRRIKEDSL